MMTERERFWSAAAVGIATLGTVLGVLQVVFDVPGVTGWVMSIGGLTLALTGAVIAVAIWHRVGRR